MTVVACSLPSAATAIAAPGWALSALSSPTNLAPTAAVSPMVNGTIEVQIFNIGSSAAGCTSGIFQREREEHLRQPRCATEVAPSDPITVTDRLPSGVRAVEAGEIEKLSPELAGIEPVIKHEMWKCVGNGPGLAPKVTEATEITCTNKATKQPGEAALEVIPGGGGAPTFATTEVSNPVPMIGISVDVQPGAQEHETNFATIAGGEAPTDAETTNPIVISPAKPPYETTSWTGWFSNEDGTIDTQAASHPYEGYFDFSLATTVLNTAFHEPEIAGGELRTAEIELPQGFIGDPTAVPQCPRELFVAEHCPTESMIGTTTAYFAALQDLAVPVFNLVPPPGVPAEFGFSLQGLNSYIDASVRTGSDYGVNEHVSTVDHKAIVQAITAIWGTPGDPSHNRWRKVKGTAGAGGCSQAQMEASGPETPEFECGTAARSSERPLLTLPASCGASLPFVLRTTSYTGNTSQRTFYMHDQQDESPLTLSGCDELAFDPALAIVPELSTSDSPTGLTVDVKPSLGGLQQPHGLSSTPIRNTTVSLPAGFVVNPGEAANLQACSPAAAALTSPAEEAAGEENTSTPACPAASKVGTASAKSPLLEVAAEKELNGNVYLLSSNPPQLKLLAALSGDGVNVKLVLNAELNERTGQIVTTVENAPELPVSDFLLTFAGGERASVDTPAHCGSFESVAQFTPWTAPTEANVTDSLSLGISSGPVGSSCPGTQLPYTPSLMAGTSGMQPGNYTTFSTSLTRPDGQQRISSLRFTAPQGLTAMISNVPQCPEPEAGTGTCPSASLIGHATVVSGPGAYPLVIPQPGEPAPEIFLTGPYHGAPFGLSIVSRLVAGPFNLGTVITRARIEVNPTTAQVTVTTDPLPQIIDGVPTDIRAINAVINRPSFMLNPTSCKPTSFTGSSEGAPAPNSTETGTTNPLSASFDITGCRELDFSPKLTVTANARTSRSEGAGLTFKLTYPKDEPGQQSNIALTKVDLPKQLPSRQSTLRLACLAATFDVNPANCPAHSVVGHAVVRTPVLPVPLSGPVYFVSHGGESFPSLTVVLQGDGVTVDLVGSTFIKDGVTSNTFKAVPDVPFSSFELNLPRGLYSAVGAYLPSSAKEDLCGQNLKMPVEFIAQNGLELHKALQIAVSGCKKTAKRAKTHGKKHPERSVKKRK